MPTQSISSQETHSRRALDSASQLIDVRTPIEYARVHAEGARSIPLDAFDPADIAAIARGHPVYLLCKSGTRATTAMEKCIAAGLKNVFVVEGGTAAWELAGLPVTRGPSVMSLERQVRIVAGSLVLTSILLGWHIHSALLLIAAFVGVGQILSGMTDTCGMGMLLARMPWNRRKLASLTDAIAGCGYPTCR